MRPQKRQRKLVVLESSDDNLEIEPPAGSQSSTISRVSTKATGIEKEKKTTAPAARKATRTAGSTTTATPQAEADGKSGKGTLHTFFNARTQAQTATAASQPRSNRGLTPVTPTEEDVEEIEEVAGRPLCGKRKITPLNAEVDDGIQITERPTTTMASKRINPAITKPWVDLFPPLTIEELAIHPKKIAEVDDWLRAAISGHAYRRLLVLKGPAGSGKTAVATTLSKARGLQVIEWSNPNGVAYGNEDYTSASAQFEDFVTGGASFESLSFEDRDAADRVQAASAKGTSWDRITMIEEVHVIARWSTALVKFRQTMMMHLSSMTSLPVVIILSEEDSSFSDATDILTAHYLLGPEILQHPAVAVIEFRAVAPTYVSKAIETTIRKEARLSGRRRIPGPPVLRALSETGDIRSAIGMLEMMCLNEDDTVLSGRVAGKGPKAAKTKVPLTKAEQATLDAISQRESSLGLFHAVGKVVYNKRETSAPDQPPPHLDEHARSLSSLVDVDELFGLTATDVDTFVAALHENFPLSCEADDSLTHIEGCLESLSDADLIANFDTAKGSSGLRRRYYQAASAVDATRHSELVFNVAVRGLLFSLPSPVRRKQNTNAGGHDPFKILYPASSRLRRQITDNQGRLAAYMLRDASQELGSTFNSARAPRSGVETWTSTRSHFASIDEEEEAASPAASVESRAVRRLDQRQLVTVQLPFVALVAARASRDLGLKDVADLVSFETASGISRQATGYKVRSESTDAGQSGDKLVGEAMQLVLSEDDIEDY